MKSFLNFLSESATQQAARMGLTGDGHGGWYKDGEFVAKTEKGRLKFYNKRQKVGGKDPAQTDKEKSLSGKQPAGAQPQPQAQPKGKVPQQDVAPKEPMKQEDDPDAPASPEKLMPPQVEKTKGTLTIAFGRFNPPTTGHEKLLDTVSKSSDDGDYIIVPSRSQDKKKNPLDEEGSYGWLCRSKNCRWC